MIFKEGNWVKGGKSILQASTFRLTILLSFSFFDRSRNSGLALRDSICKSGLALFYRARNPPSDY